MDVRRPGADRLVGVDIDGIRGTRCENIVTEFAQAVGGQITGQQKNEAYWQLPGEPVKTRVRA